MLHHAEDYKTPVWLTNCSPQGELAAHISSRAWCLIDNLRLPEAMEACHFAYRLVPEPEYEHMWALASTMEKIVSRIRERRDSRFYSPSQLVNLANESHLEPNFPSVLERARQDLQRIVGLFESADRLPELEHRLKWAPESAHRSFYIASSC